jgi:hypothetical protein
MVVTVNTLFNQVYDRVKGGDEYQKKLDVLPTRVAECEEAIRQEQGQVEVKQAEKAEQVQLCKMKLPPVLVMLTMCNSLHMQCMQHTLAPQCAPQLRRCSLLWMGHGYRLMHLGLL